MNWDLHVFGEPPIMQRLELHLPPLSWINLVRASPTCYRKYDFRAYLNRITEMCLRKNLMHYFERTCGAAVDVLFNHLRDGRFALSGGFLLATITGDDFHMQGDLDIIHVMSPLDNVLPDRSPLIQDLLAVGALERHVPCGRWCIDYDATYTDIHLVRVLNYLA